MTTRLTFCLFTYLLYLFAWWAVSLGFPVWLVLKQDWSAWTIPAGVVTYYFCTYTPTQWVAAFFMPHVYQLAAENKLDSNKNESV